MQRVGMWTGFVAAMVIGAHAHAQSAKGVGLGVAGGVDYYNVENQDGEGSFAWGFFVDIPLLETFYITPQTTIYELDLGFGKSSVTDVDLNFKFIIPLSALRLGAGVTAGITTGLGDYRGHWGLLGYGGLELVENLEGFVMAQYKQFNVEGADISNIHIFGGGMFRF